MFPILDLLAFLMCALVWLGPFFYNLGHGRCRLLHPTGFFPLMVVYMLIPPLVFRWQGETMRLTSAMYDSTWFLVEPMLILAFSGIFYHLGVRLSKTSLVLGRQDEVAACLHLKASQGPTLFLFIITLAAIVLPAIFYHYLRSQSDYLSGYYWVHLLFSSYRILPVLVFQQHISLGIIYLFMVLPLTVAYKSKGVFLFIVAAFLIFYQQKLWRKSKLLIVMLTVLVIMTPLAYYLYLERDVDDLQGLQKLGTDMTPSWEETFVAITHRDYALESFACVIQESKAEEKWHWGEKTLNDFLENVPAFIYPNKPVALFTDFTALYLPLDYRGYLIHFSRFFLSPFYLDFGLAGVALAGLLIGTLYGFGYRFALRATFRRQESWPVIMYLCLVINAKYLVEANFFAALADTLGMSLPVFLVAWTAGLAGRRKPWVRTMEQSPANSDPSAAVPTRRIAGF